MDDRKSHRSWIRVGSLILFLTFASALAFADSLRMILTSSGGGKFDYALSVTGAPLLRT